MAICSRGSKTRRRAKEKAAEKERAKARKENRNSTKAGCEPSPQGQNIHTTVLGVDREARSLVGNMSCGNARRDRHMHLRHPRVSCREDMGGRPLERRKATRRS